MDSTALYYVLGLAWLGWWRYEWGWRRGV